jgi:hypothetical protein
MNLLFVEGSCLSLPSFGSLSGCVFLDGSDGAAELCASAARAELSRLVGRVFGALVRGAGALARSALLWRAKHGETSGNREEEE